MSVDIAPEIVVLPTAIIEPPPSSPEPPVVPASEPPAELPDADLSHSEGPKEATVKKEVSTEQHLKEIGMVGRGLLENKAEEEESPTAVATLKDLQARQDREYNEDWSSGEPVIVQHDGKKYKIQGLVSVSGESFFCRLESPDGATRIADPVPIARSEVIRGQLIAEKVKILEQFKGEEMEVVELYIATEESGADILKTKDPEQLNKIIRETSVKAGVTRDVDIEAYTEKVASGDEHKEARERILAVVAGVNIIDAHTLMEVFKASGIDPTVITRAKVDGMTQMLEKGINWKTEQPFASKAEKEEAQKELDKANVTLQVFSEIGGLEGVESFLVEQLDQGKMSSANRGKLIEAIRKASVDDILDALYEQEISDGMKDQEAERIRQLRKALAKKAGIAGGAAILLLLVSAIRKSTRAQH